MAIIVASSKYDHYPKDECDEIIYTGNNEGNLYVNI